MSRKQVLNPLLLASLLVSVLFSVLVLPQTTLATPVVLDFDTLPGPAWVEKCWRHPLMLRAVFLP